MLQPKPENYYSLARVRNSLLYYLFGRGAASLASFLSAILLIRIFPVSIYATYTAFSGLLMLINTVSNGGIERIIPKFLPELKQAGAERSLYFYIIWLFILRIIFTLCLLIPVYVFSDIITPFLSIAEGSATIFSFCVFVLVRVGTSQLSLVLQALLHQRDAAIGGIIEYVSRLIAIILSLLVVDHLGLETVYWIFAGSCALGATYLGWKVYGYTQKNYRKVNEGEFNTITPLRCLKLGWHNYLYQLLDFPTSPSANKLLSARFLSAGETASLGFSYALVDVMMRYLPAALLMGLIEPVFIARYSKDRKFDNLNQMALLVFKINIFIIAPATAWMAFSGMPVIDAITGGKYTDAAFIIAALMVLMVINSHQLVLHIIVNAIEETHLLVASNLRVLLFLPLYVILVIRWSLIGLLAGSIMLAIIQSYYVISRLRKMGYYYTLDTGKLLRIVMTAFGSFWVAHQFSFEVSDLTMSIITAVIASILYMVILYFWKAFSVSERDLLNRFMGRKVLIW